MSSGHPGENANIENAAAKYQHSGGTPFSGEEGQPGGAGFIDKPGGNVNQPAETERAIPTVFRWEHGGNNVHITGTFNNWSKRIPMHRSGNDFVYIQSLPPGTHAYKFIVDDDWRYAPDQQTAQDSAGNINNIIDVTNFNPEGEEEQLQQRRDSGAYGQSLPDEESYTKDAPLLPPHLRNIILNSRSPDPADSSQLMTPNHVSLYHLNCSAIRENLMVQAVSQRYRKKFVSTVFYRPLPATSSAPSAAVERSH